jgi:hypothetical protein
MIRFERKRRRSPLGDVGERGQCQLRLGVVCLGEDVGHRQIGAEAVPDAAPPQE